MKLKWTAAVQFERCYLSTYKSKPGLIYMTREAYSLLGKPKRVMVFSVRGRTIALSPALKYGEEVRFTVNGQPFIVHEASKRIADRLYFSHDEEDIDTRRSYRHKRRYFYFRVSSSVPTMPQTSPKKLPGR